MVTEPPVVPYTTPEASTVAIEVAELLHVPVVEVSDKVIVVPEHIVVAPLMAPTTG